jgi:hypothetical protein
MAKTKTTQQSQEQSHTNTASTATTQKNVPAWIQQPNETYLGNVNNLQGQGPGAFAPQVSGLQDQAFVGGQNLANSGYFEQAGNALNNMRDVTSGNVGAGAVTAQDIAAERINAASLLDGGLERYYNPFKDQITNPVLADLDAQAGQTRAAQAADAARNKAFGGSRYGIQEAQTEGELARGRAATHGGLLKGMYEHSTGLAGQDADRRQSAAVANAANALAASQANQRAQLEAMTGNRDATLSADTGNRDAALTAAQGNQQAGLDRGRALGDLGASETDSRRQNIALQGDLGAQQSEALNRQRQYPIEFQSQIGDLLGNVNPGDYSGQTVDMTGTTDMTGSSSGSGTSKTKQGLLDMVGMGAQIGSMFLSDRRAKTDVRTGGYDGRGRRWVTFAYAWAPLARFFGVIAQEVQRTDPLAVALGPDGFLRVNYGALR